jgi:hypothetical protein
VDYEVKLAQVESRRTALVAAATTWQDFPALWGQLLGEVWECLRAGGIYRGCRNIMLYLDSVPNVEIGVRPDGTRWEIYGPHNDDPAQQWAEVYLLLLTGQSRPDEPLRITGRYVEPVENP